MSAKPLLIADENIHAGLISKLRAQDYTVYSIRENSAGISDNEVINIATGLEGILLTEDSDFGELVFSHGVKSLGILFIRYDWRELDTILYAILTALSSQNLHGKFCTLTVNKIRIRSLP